MHRKSTPPTSHAAHLAWDSEDADRPLPTVTVAEIPQTVLNLIAVGVRSVKVFANSLHRNQQATGAVAPDSLMVRAIHAVRTPGLASR
ncbi:MULTISPECIES: hypothetical protein [Streptomyces]|uniref:hypothetical protein n=1 Tax=Streptomyces TaxID=1883 RepID=UPI0004BFC308|nr:MULTISPECIES: hypothetical protein [Streptomyces]